jgi:peroxidase
MDHSPIYGYSKSFTDAVRTFVGGRLRLGQNTLPMDINGRYISSSDRFWKVIAVGMIWPVIFSRFHNYLADGLRGVNPDWEDEKLFEEARRINIAWLQNFVYNDGMLKHAFNLEINEKYDENIDPSTGVCS